MKFRNYFLAFGFAFSLVTSAQNCQNPVSNVIYQTQFNQIAVQQSNQKKLDKALEYVNAGCYMSQQVKNIALLFTEDSYRLDFCKAAYTHTFDQVNFFDVYDAFSSMGFALRLYDFVKSGSKSVVALPNIGVTGTSTGTTTTNNQTGNTGSNTGNSGATWPNWNYPDYTKYTGKKGCQGPVMSETDFKNFYTALALGKDDKSKNTDIKTASDKVCLSIAQLMKLGSLLSTEDAKFEMLIVTFARSYDLENYPSANVLLTNPALQAEWVKFAKNTITPPCVVADADFNSIMTSVKAKNFPNDKYAVIDMAQKDRCFSVDQIRKFGKEMTFGKDKLKVFKLLYAKCTDQSNYYKMMDDLVFQSEKDELKKFIDNGGK